MSGGGKIGALVAKLENLGSDELLRRASAAAAEAARLECLNGFEQEMDPYGIPWARRKDPKSFWPILNKSGDGKNSLTVTPMGQTVRFSIRGYFKFHQEGTRYMIARRVFPTQSRGLGLWREPIERAVMKVYREAMQ